MDTAVVILNWNARAPEIVNDLLYSDHKETVVALVKSGGDDIRKEIEERLHQTIEKENAPIIKKAEKMSFFARRRYLKNHKLGSNVSFIVIEGNIFSQKQLEYYRQYQNYQQPKPRSCIRTSFIFHVMTFPFYLKNGFLFFCKLLKHLLSFLPILKKLLQLRIKLFKFGRTLCKLLIIAHYLR